MRGAFLINLMICVLLMSLSATATARDFVYQNEVGLFLAEDDLGTFSAPLEDYIFHMYLILLNPYLDNENSPDEPGTVPVESIREVHCRVGLPPSLFMGDPILPVYGVNIAPLPDLVLGYGEPVPVVDGVVVLAEIQFFVLEMDRSPLYLQPAQEWNVWPEHLSATTRLDNNDLVSFKMYPISGAIDAPVFIFNPADGEPVTTEAASWSDLKALYR